MARQGKSSQRFSFEEREKVILEAAAELFSQKGFVGTTTSAIAHRAGVNEALLFRHYPSKESLYTALLRRKISRLFQHVIPVLEKSLSQPLSVGLLKVAKMFIREHQRDPRPFRMMLYAALENHRLSAYLFKQRLPFVEFLERFLTQKIAQGEVKRQNPKIMARAFLAMIHNYILATQVFKARNFYPVSKEKILKNYVLIFTRGVAA